MEDLKTGDLLFPPNFVTIHHLREQFQQRQPQPPPQQQQLQRQERLLTRRGSPPREPPRRVTTASFPPPAEKDQRKHPEQELSQRGTDVECDGVKASPGQVSRSRPSNGIIWAVRRNARVNEGSDGREATGSSGPKPSERPNRGECAGFGAEEKAKSALMKDQQRRPEEELPRRETNTERERGKASPRKQYGSRPSPANRGGFRRNTSVKEGSGGRQATDSNNPKPSEKSSLGEYADFGADAKAESASVAAASVVAESAEQVKKTEELEKEEKKKKKKKNKKNKNNNTRKGKGGLNKDIVRAKEKGAKPEEGEVNEPVEEVKEEKFQCASSESQKVMLESKEVRVEAKTEEVVVHVPAKEAKKLFPRAGSESENLMPESKELQVEVEKVAANDSHVRAKAEGFINPKVEIEGDFWQVRYVTKRDFQSRRSNCRDHRGYRVIEGKKQQRGVWKQSGDLLWAKPEEGEVNEPVEEVKEEKFQCASSESQNVMLESKEVRVEAKTEEVVVHVPAKEAKKLFPRAGSESENVMPESKELQVAVEKVAANDSHVRAKAEGLNKQVRVINPKVEIEEDFWQGRYVTKRDFQSRRSNRGDHRGYGVIEGKKQQRGAWKRSGDLLWVRKEDRADDHASESSS